MTTTEATDTPIVDTPTAEQIGRLTVLKCRVETAGADLDEFLMPEDAREGLNTLNARNPWAVAANSISDAVANLEDLIGQLVQRMDGE